MFKERLSNLRGPALTALGGLAVGFAWRGHQARRQLAAAENARLASEAENQRLKHEVAHDDLTGLLTKKALIQRGNERLTQTPDRVYALVFFDLDNFKAINDNHPGKYDEGDRTLRTAGQVLLHNIRTRGEAADLLAHGQRQDGEAARLGGDEFAGLFELTPRTEQGQTMSEQEKLAAICDRIRADFRSEFAGRPDLEALGGVDLSIGAVVRQPGETMEDLLSRGAILMSQEKQDHHAQNGSYRL